MAPHVRTHQPGRGPRRGRIPSAVLTATGLNFAFSPGRPVLREIGLSLAPGRLTALVGPNGSGKSTLLRCLAGLLSPAAGSVTLDGKPVQGWPAAARAARLAYVAQRPEVAFGFTTLDVVRFGLLTAGRPDRADNGDPAARALLRVGLADRSSEPFAHLSVGQQQRAALARALAQLEGTVSTNGDAPPPAFLLADEPLSAMDPRHALASMDLLRALARATTPRPTACLVALHDLSMAARFADDAILLDTAGRIAAAGPAGDVLTPDRLAPVFGVRFARIDHPVPALLPITDETGPIGTGDGTGPGPID